MTAILTILSSLTFLIILISNIEIFLAWKSVVYLRDIEPQFDKSAPCVSIIVPACNEEKEIAAALQSLLGQDYPNLEIIVINDRSTDRTGEILDEFVRNHSTLRVIHKTELPEDWLGKNHALQVGSTYAHGQYLLFTDADVVMKKATVSKAVQFMLNHNLDHLAVAPEMRAATWKIDLMIGTFIYYFNLITKPWRAQNPNSRYSVGIGAFNLLKAETYKAIGTHRAIALRPDDDIMLGRLVKSRGYRQRVVFGKRLIRIQWYFSVRDMIAGLMKNTASFVNYSLVLCL
jgi:cellulose synthase/poly-beta-1,6-N-acetylglucosamine synthase-like glycosyltransferase